MVAQIMVYAFKIISYNNLNDNFKAKNSTFKFIDFNCNSANTIDFSIEIFLYIYVYNSTNESIKN